MAVFLWEATTRKGEVKKGETSFRHRETRNIEVPFPAKSIFRLIVADDQIEVYVNDYFIEYIETESALSGGLGIIGHSSVSDVKAWIAAPNDSGPKGTK